MDKVVRLNRLKTCLRDETELPVYKGKSNVTFKSDNTTVPESMKGLEPCYMSTPNCKSFGNSILERPCVSSQKTLLNKFHEDDSLKATFHKKFMDSIDKDIKKHKQQTQ